MSADLVEVHVFAAARAAIGEPVVLAAAGTLGQILDEIERGHPAFASVRPMCSYLLDGVVVHRDQTSVSVSPGRRLDVLPPFAGG
jgi:sulfur-carrier protein